MKLTLSLVLLLGLSFSSFAADTQAPGRAPASAGLSCAELSDLLTLNVMTMYKTSDNLDYKRDQMQPTMKTCPNGQVLFTATASYHKDVIFMKIMAKKSGSVCEVLDVAASKVEANLPKDNCK